MKHFIAAGAISILCAASLMAEPIKEVRYFDLFDPPKTKLAYQETGLARKEINFKLVRQAQAEAETRNIKLVFLKAIRDTRLAKVFLIFEIQHHDDLFWVYAADKDQKKLTCKFRFSSV